MVKNNEILQRLQLLRTLMREHQIDAYYIGSEDFHGSEYVGEYFRCRAYMSGFTGSAGTLVVLMDRAALWTDGRYFLQAEDQLKNTGIDLVRIGIEGEATIEEYLLEHLDRQAVVAMDARTITFNCMMDFEKKLAEKQITFRKDLDLVGNIWTDRPEMSAEPVWILEAVYAGRSVQDKLTEIRSMMKEKQIQSYLIASLDDIGWLFNIRGNDIAHTPVALAYVFLTQKECTLFIQQKAVSLAVAEALRTCGVTLADYHEIYDYLSKQNVDNVYLDGDKVNAALEYVIPKNVERITGLDLTAVPKARKNPVEVQNTKKAHIRDGVALTKFIYWLKTHVATEHITEISAAEKLLDFRKMQEHFIDESFEPIMGYGAHGAIIHYSATEETDAQLRPEGLLLMDTGGHYLEGTTDVTRTIALGTVTQQMKQHYTAVMKGNLALGNCHFTDKTNGTNLDYVAREPLWQMGLDYRHGTGHGVGYLMNVHEGPQNISQRYTPGRTTAFAEGMITSDEPGVYIEGAYGIRLENLMVCVADEHTEYGQFLHFEPLTLVPFDAECIEMSMLDERDVERLDRYHAKVYEALAPYFEGGELEWLRKQCASHH